MKFWIRFGRTQKRLAMVAGLIGSLVVIGAFVNKGVQKWNEYTGVPDVVDSLSSEIVLTKQEMRVLRDDQDKLKNINEMMWNLLMANTERYGRKDYYITSVGDVLMEGAKIKVFLREDHASPAGKWLFFKICEGRDCLHFLFTVGWSSGYSQHFFVDFQGEEHLIYQE